MGLSDGLGAQPLVRDRVIPDRLERPCPLLDRCVEGHQDPTSPDGLTVARKIARQHRDPVPLRLGDHTRTVVVSIRQEQHPGVVVYPSDVRLIRTQLHVGSVFQAPAKGTAIASTQRPRHLQGETHVGPIRSERFSDVDTAAGQWVHEEQDITAGLDLALAELDD
jgi:hypothetical protein